MSAGAEPSSRDRGVAGSGSGASAEPTATDAVGEPRAPTIPRTGERIGRYVVLAPLGAGAMGMVVSAYDAELDRRVAIKLIRDPSESRPVDASRLLREAQALARLSHPNVVPVYDAGTTANGSVFVAMELVEGSTLREWIELAPRRWPQVLTVMAAAADGLAAAHAAQIVHRDFKPDNVLLDRQGVPKVSDFGLSRGQGDADVSSTDIDAPAALDERLTRTGAVMGTPGYMSPEQHVGASIDASSDQYSFFVTLYELLWGVRPFRGRDVMALAYAKLHGAIEPPPRRRGGDPPKAVFELIRRGLSPEPTQRFVSMSDVAAALRRLASRSRSRALVPLALALTTAAVVTVRREPPSACADADGQLADAWDASRRAAVVAAFASANTPAAARATAATLDALDAHVESWRARYQATCDLRGSADTDASFACLRRRRAHLQAVTAMLAEGGRQTVHRAGEIVAALESPAECAQAPAEPGVPETEEREALWGLIDRASVRIDGGQYDAGRALARDAEAEALRLGDAKALAEARLQLGVAQTRSGRFVEAAQAYRASFDGAVELGDDALAARGALRLVFLDAGEHAGTDDARRWVRHAEALIHRLPPPRERLEARLHEVYAQVLENEGDEDGARARMERALELRASFDEPDSLAMSTLRNNMATLLTRQGRFDEGRALHERALADRMARVGPMHPDVAMSLLNLGQVQFYLGELDAALASFARAEPIIAQTMGWAHPWMVTLRMSRAGTLGAMGEFDRAHLDAQFALSMSIVRSGPDSLPAARAWNILGGVFHGAWDLDGAQWAFSRSLSVYQVAGGDEDFGAGLTRANLGGVALRRGELDRAQGLVESALEMIARRFGPNHFDTGLCYVYLATVAVERGQPRQALELLDRAAWVLGGSEHSGGIFVQLHAQRARALWALGRDRRLARQEAEHALALQSRPSPERRMLEQWLASHPIVDEGP
ncbi:MAG: serine/threonine-protein kinase [Nannocystaceae bacterium]|nr:serine/threonine-protein kinase [Nannocystaceae bacterium]